MGTPKDKRTSVTATRVEKSASAPSSLDPAVAVDGWAIPSHATITEACQVVCDRLGILGLPLSSVYLLRGERLRCHASNGYGQVFDGIRSEGVIGTAFLTGQTQVIDPTTDPAYVASAVGTRTEIAVPLLIAGSAVGVVDTESWEQLGPEHVVLIESAAAALAGHLPASGEVSVPMWQRVADASAEFVRATTLDELANQACMLCLELPGAQAASVYLPGAIQTTNQARGDASYALTSAPVVAEISGWLEHAKTCFSLLGTSPQGRATPRFVGENFSVATVIDRREQAPGHLFVIGGENTDPTPETGEQLEVIAALVAAGALNIQSIVALTDAAQRDPLTGLLHRRVFRRLLDQPPQGGLLTAVFAIDIDNFKSVNDTMGHDVGDRALAGFAQVLRDAIRIDDAVFRVGGDEFAAIVEFEDRADITITAERLVSTARDSGTAVSVGIALARGNENLSAAWRDADAALLGVKRSGRNGWSIVG